MTKIVVIVGSLRQDSLNKKLAMNLEQLAPEDVTFEYASINLPLFSQDSEAELPESVKMLKATIESADGLLFVTPEYNRSIPGVLKNAIDWATRPNGSNSFRGKPVGIVGASDGRLGTAAAQAHLRDILVHLGMIVMGQPAVYFVRAQDLYDETGQVKDEISKDSLHHYISELSHWIETKK